jgi:hypothetical protein
VEGVRGYFRDSVHFSTESVCVLTRRVLGVFLYIYIYIYLIDVNLDYYQNNSRLFVDVSKLPNHVKSVCLSLLISLFSIIYTIHHYCDRLQQLVSESNHMMAGIDTSSAKFDVMKFDGFENFGLWQRHVKDLLVQQGMVKALYGTKPEWMADIDWKELEVKAVATIRLCLRDDVMYHVMDEESLAAVWLKLESRYM